MPIVEVTCPIDLSRRPDELSADCIAVRLVKALLEQVPGYEDVNVEEDSIPAALAGFLRGFFEIYKNAWDARAPEITIKFVRLGTGRDLLLVSDKGEGITNPNILKGKNYVNYSEVVDGGFSSTKKGKKGVTGGAGIGLAQLTNLFRADEFAGTVVLAKGIDGGTDLMLCSKSVDITSADMFAILLRECERRRYGAVGEDAAIEFVGEVDDDEATETASSALSFNSGGALSSPVSDASGPLSSPSRAAASLFKRPALEIPGDLDSILFDDEEDTPRPARERPTLDL